MKTKHFKNYAIHIMRRLHKFTEYESIWKTIIQRKLEMEAHYN